MPHQGYTVTPVMSEDSNGQEYVSDFQLDAGHNIPADAFNQYDFNEATGEVTHRFSTDSDPDEEFVQDIDSQYEQALLAANPDLPSAIEWASRGGISGELIDEFNNAMESGDPELMNPAIQWLLQNFEESGDQYEYAEDDEGEGAPDEALDPETYALGEEIIADLQEAEPEFVVSFDMDEVAKEALNTGDQCLAEAATLSAQFHRGEIEAADAINYMLDNYMADDLLRVAEALEL